MSPESGHELGFQPDDSAAEPAQAESIDLLEVMPWIWPRRKRKHKYDTDMLYLAVFALSWVVTDIGLGAFPSSTCDDPGFQAESLLLNNALLSVLCCMVPMLLVATVVYYLYLREHSVSAGLGAVALLALGLIVACGGLGILASGSITGVGLLLFAILVLAPLLALVWPLFVADLIGRWLTLKRQVIVRLRVGFVALAGGLWALLLGYLLAWLSCGWVELR